MITVTKILSKYIISIDVSLCLSNKTFKNLLQYETEQRSLKLIRLFLPFFKHIYYQSRDIAWSEFSLNGLSRDIVWLTLSNFLSKFNSVHSKTKDNIYTGHYRMEWLFWSENSQQLVSILYFTQCTEWGRVKLSHRKNFMLAMNELNTRIIILLESQIPGTCIKVALLFSSTRKVLIKNVLLFPYN